MPSLTKRHFERVARDLREMREAAPSFRRDPGVVLATIDELERRLEVWFMEENGAFDREVFRSAARPRPIQGPMSRGEITSEWA